jgi:hypothetical protein
MILVTRVKFQLRMYERCANHQAGHTIEAIKLSQALGMRQAK